MSIEYVMKVDYGDNYKSEIESGWQDSKGTLGLAKLKNPFKKFGTMITTSRPFHRKLRNDDDDDDDDDESTNKEFKKLDVNKKKSISYSELKQYISKRTRACGRK